MSLRKQLLLISLITLLLPWAGYQFIQEMEATLRQGQQQALGGIARVLAQQISGQPELAQALPVPETSSVLYAHRLQAAPILDGYADDWHTHALLPERMSEGDLAVEWLAGTHGDRFYLLLEVTDPNIRYERPDLAPERTDQVLLRLGHPQRDIQLAVSTPGPFMRDGRRGFYLPLRGAWQDIPNGYRLELSLPLERTAEGLGFAVIDAPGDDSLELHAGSVGARSVGLVDPRRIEPLPRAIHAAEELQAALAPYLRTGSRVSILDRQGWLLATAGDIQADAVLEGTDGDRMNGGNQKGEPADSGLLMGLFRAILNEDAPRNRDDDFRRGRLRGDAVRSALTGTVGYDWFARPGETRAILAAAHPIRVDGEPVGAVYIEQTTDAIVSLSNQALLRLMSLSLGTLVAILLVLLGFATLLSWRVRRLRNNVERAISPEGRLGVPFAASTATDELGDLSRSFVRILGDLRGYTDYLESFAAKLSHELKTPLAIVKSSLDNLEMATPASTQGRDATYVARARQGVERLSQILYAMREAARLEHSIIDTEKEWFDVTSVLSDAAPAYAGVLPKHRWEWELPPGPVQLHGSPELLVQLLDKLVDNARDFTPEGGSIRLRLQIARQTLLLDLENEGSALPHGDIFASFVSLREPAGQEGHLGLGLVIVRLIAEFHQGRVQAENLPQGGVRIRVRLPYITSAT